MDRMTQILIDLHEATDGRVPLVLVGGFGLYLKQLRLADSGERTLFPSDQWPVPRTTEDIDLLLHAEFATDPMQMRQLRVALDRLGFVPIESAKYYQFVRIEEIGAIKIDLLVGPLGEYRMRVKDDPRRVRPQPSVGLHARKAPEAIGVEEESTRAPIGEERQVEVRLPNALTFALMKLGALSDRANDSKKDLGRHHALDLFRCVAMLTPSEDEAAARLRHRYAGHQALVAGQQQAAASFSSVNGLGRIRLQEHSLLPRSADLGRFVRELGRLVSGDRWA